MIEEILNPESHHEGKKRRKINLWMISSIVLILVLIGLIIIPNPITGSAISQSQAGDKILEFAQSQGLSAEIVDIKSLGNIYEVTILLDGQQLPTYITKDGKYFVSSVFPLEEVEDTDSSDPNTNQPTPTEVPKNDKPVVELFIMSHCPYGTQAEKGILPVARTLGDKIDFKIRYVYYAMHGETEVYEQLNQYCIQEEQSDKFLDYLDCFLEAGDGESCLTSVGIDAAKLETCTSAADTEFSVTVNLEDTSSYLSGQFPLFNIHATENSQYNVGGSPTLIINGVESNAGRDSASYLAGICNAFNTAPEECNEVLSSTSPGPGFGWSTTGGSNSAAQCG